MTTRQSIIRRVLIAGLFALLAGRAVADGVPLQIAITTHLGDQQEFQAGDRVQFLLDLNRDAHVLLIYQDAQGALTQLVPNSLEKTGFYKAARYISIPDPRLPFEFVVGEPFGSEAVWAFAADQPFPELEGTPLDNGLKKLSRSLEAVVAQLNQSGSRGETRFVAARVQLSTHARR